MGFRPKKNFWKFWKFSLIYFFTFNFNWFVVYVMLRYFVAIFSISLNRVRHPSESLYFPMVIMYCCCQISCNISLNPFSNQPLELQLQPTSKSGTFFISPVPVLVSVLNFFFLFGFNAWNFLVSVSAPAAKTPSLAIAFFRFVGTYRELLFFFFLIYKNFHYVCVTQF